jgi:hypothetical protein
MTKYLCPVCRAPFDRNLQSRLSGTTHLRLALITIALVAGTYALLGTEAAIKSAFFYIPLWGLTEFGHWVRMREAAQCRVCDFDPMLYQRDWRAARAKIETRMNKLSAEMQDRIYAQVKIMGERRTAAAAARSARPENSVPPPPAS